MQKIVALLLDKNSIPFDKQELSFQIQSHPSYPSLHAITGVLDHFNIENIAARVPQTQEVFRQLPNCFIAQVKNRGNLQLALIEKKGNSCRLYDQEGKKRTLDQNEFLDSFTGIIVGVEKDDEQTVGVSSRKSVVANIGFLLTAAFVSVLFAIGTPSLAFYVLFTTSILGTLISVSILKQESGIKNTIGDAFCSSETDKKDCNAVLTSNGATIVRGYKLSDLCLIYFVGLSLAIFLLSIQGLGLNLIYWIGIASLSITLYSIIYQAFAVKAWCLLCLSIIGILWIQVATSFILGPFSFGLIFSIPALMTILVSFLGSFSIWSFTGPKITKARDDARYKVDHYKFKRNYSLFSTLLKDGHPLDTTIDDNDEIIFGNTGSNVQITIVTNPFCGHCKPVHTIVEDILKKFNHQVKIVIRFYVSTDDKEGDVVRITTHLMHIYHNEGPQVCLKAMDDAYNNLKPKEWLNKWTRPKLELDRFFNTLEIQENWCIENKINFTPEILVNGYSFPKEYDRADISFFIEDLHEEYNPASSV